MTDYELAQREYDLQEPPESSDGLDELGENEDLYDLAARLIACTL